MKTYFIVSDVHSFYNELQEALNKYGWDLNNPNHILISLGDLLDRGPDAIKCLEFANDLISKNRMIAIRGNHEDLIEEAIVRGRFLSHDFHNCTNDTVYQITGSTIDTEALSLIKDSELLYRYLDSTINYAEINNNIFVHGWIPVKLEYSNDGRFSNLSKLYRPYKEVYDKNWRTATLEVWDAARWKNGMYCWLANIREPNKTIWCGHYHTSWGHANIHNDGQEFIEPIETFYIDPDTGKQEPHANFEPFIDDGIIAMDACTALTKFVNCKILTIKED